MGLLSYFKRKTEPSATALPPAEVDGVAAARTLARRRLIGATVLLGLGVIGFPLLFETQPRPIAIDIPIEIPRKDGAPLLALPPLAVAAAPSAPVAAAAKPRGASAPVEVVESAADLGRELPAPPSAAQATPSTSVLASAKPSAAKPAATKPVDDGVRARALLDGDAAASAPGARVVVQVGAFTDAGKVSEARYKLEKLGLKTYTQVVEVEGSKRTRVRVGPFANRAEAEKASARIRAAGLPAAILTL